MHNFMDRRTATVRPGSRTSDSRVPRCGSLRQATAVLCILHTLLVTAARPAPPAAFTLDAPWQRLVTDLVRETIPHNYVNEKDWGQTREVVRGLYIKREGWRIKTHRTRKTVNHGTWKRYRIDLLDPDRQFQLRVEHVRVLPSGRTAFDLLCDAQVRVFGRLSQWQQGVQLISLSAEADAGVALAMQCDLAVRWDTTHEPHALVLDPVVRSADLTIKGFRMREISQLDGPLIHRLSASIREVLEDEIARRREKIVQKINHQIDKHRDQLRVTWSDVLGQ